MTFADIVAALSKELGTGIESVGDVCAIRAGAEDGTAVTVVLHGLDECGGVLLAADLGEPPSEGRDRLLRVLLEANDLFRDTAGATLSLDPDRRAARGVAKRVENHEWTRMDGNGRDLHENKERRFAGKKKRQGRAPLVGAVFNVRRRWLSMVFNVPNLCGPAPSCETPVRTNRNAFPSA